MKEVGGMVRTGRTKDKTTQKMKTGNNIIQKLAGLSWGASAKCIRFWALSLVYSTAKYDVPIWLNSRPTKMWDCKLNMDMEYFPLHQNHLRWTGCQSYQALLHQIYEDVNPYLKSSTKFQTMFNSHFMKRPLRLRSSLGTMNFQISKAFNIHIAYGMNRGSPRAGRSSHIFSEDHSDNEFESPTLTD